MNKKKMTRKEGVLKVFAPIWAVLIAFLASYLVTIKPESFWLAGGICAVLYVGVLMLSLFIAGSIDEKNMKKASKGPMITGVMYEKINSMNEPAVLCDGSYKIVWANKFVQETNQGVIVGTTVQNLFSYKIKDGEIGKRPVDTIVTYKGKNYIVEEEPVRSGDKSYYLLTLRDTTELLDLKKQMQDEDSTIVALLHDVVEDTDMTIEGLRDMGFSERVCDAISLMTHKDGVPYMEYVASIKQNPIAKAVKLADLRHNSDMTRLDSITLIDVAREEKYRRAIEILLSDE